MSISAMKQALKFCEEIGDLRGPYPFVNETSIVSDSRKVLKALRQAIAEAEKQEPVGYVSEPGSCTKVGTNSGVLHTEWVGLTDEDIDLYAFDIGVTDNKAPAWLVTYAKAIEAKLKEKNT
jgi:hypothetical protein